MLKHFKKFLGIDASPDFAALVKQGALIIDVRSRDEYDGGHVKGSVNIPLDNLEAGLHKLKNKSKPIITCCASGMRSASAKRMLNSYGYTEVYNAGSWKTLQNKLH